MDFELKRINEETKREKLRYEIEKSKFYQKQKEEKVRELSKEIIGKKIGVFNKKNDEMEKSRLQWEKQIIMDMSTGVENEGKITYF